jgi:hypothetical protein
MIGTLCVAVAATDIDIPKEDSGVVRCQYPGAQNFPPNAFQFDVHGGK